MSAIDDAKTVIQILAGSLPDNPRLIRIADAFVDYAGPAFNPVDPNNPTNEEKAQNFLNMLRRDGRKTLRRYGEDQWEQANQGNQQQAGDDAADDL